MEFRILGPLEFVDGDTIIRPQAAKQRALLGVLLLQPNEVVSSERLIDELWGERPPATAAKTLQTYVSQLRRLLGADVIATRPPGYVLRVEEDAVDAARFRRLTAEGRRLVADGKYEQAHAAYVEGLALWRGLPLADVVFESFARNEVERLEEERVAALTERIDCELALGRHDDVIAELKTLVKQYPLRERLWAQLMLALYRSGRQADALAVYQDARRTFVDQLGLEPSRELQNLERAILTHEATLQPPPPVARERPRQRQRRRQRALVVAMVALLVAALGIVAFAVGDEPARMPLPPNSVGFIDAESGRVTRSFRVGDQPVALAVVNDSVWAANFRDRTVTRVPGKKGRDRRIAVDGRPIGMTAYRGTLWVLTENGLLVPIDPRFGRVGDPIRLREPGLGGRVTAGAGSLWLTVPEAIGFGRDPANPSRILPTVHDAGFVLRVNLRDPERPIVIRPNGGAHGPITYRDGEVWTAGSGYVFAIAPDRSTPSLRARVGAVSDLALGAESLWVLSRGGSGVAAVTPAGRRVTAFLPDAPIRLRRVELDTRSVHDPISVGDFPAAVAVAAGSTWVASYDGKDGTVYRVDPIDERVVDTIPLGARPTALAADRNGIWVAVR
jgi:DNA-binding SARP family transcriptional activator/DNA-binding beta-propeller fold protein YncE